MKRFFLSSAFFACFLLLSKGQDVYTEQGNVLGDLFRRLEQDTIDNEKLVINDSIKNIIDKYATSDSIFNHKFYNLRHLGQITSPDSLLKIITWNLNLGSGGKYCCYFIRKKTEGNIIYRLSASYNEDPPADTIYSSANWYGALYYDIMPCEINNYKYWILLGVDYGNPLVSRKVIETLGFSSDDSLVLGRKCFEQDGKLSFRKVMEYSSTASMSLRFSSDTSIVFDHLVSFSPSVKDNPMFFAPDYSYDAFRLGNGIWKFFLNIDARNRE